MATDERTLPGCGRPAAAVLPREGRDVVRCGAELVELSERFYRGIVIGGLVFVGMASIAALVFLPLRESDATYTTATVPLVAILVVAVPFAVRNARRLYGVLLGSEATQIAVVVLAAALVVHPLRSELRWPSCALLTLVPLRRALAYCLGALLANLLAHVVVGEPLRDPTGIDHRPVDRIRVLVVGVLRLHRPTGRARLGPVVRSLSPGAK